MGTAGWVIYGLMVRVTPWMYNARTVMYVTFDTSATTATNADSIPVGTAVPGELPGELEDVVVYC